MQQATQAIYGGPEVIELRDVPVPRPGPNDVLVRVHAATLTLADTAFRKADPFIVRFFGGLLRPRDLVHGSNISGIVEAVGAAVTRFQPGDAVYGAATRGHGDYICVPETAALVIKPAALDHAGAAGLSYGFLTALPFLRNEAALQPGHSILINGASGSIGTVAVQLAKHFGAHVTAVCSGRNAELVLSLGADRVIDYQRADFTVDEGAYDIIFDTVGKSAFARCKRALKPHGGYLTTVPSLAVMGEMLTTFRQRGKWSRLATTGLRKDPLKIQDLQLLSQLAEASAMHPVIDRQYPLTEIVEAHRYVDTERKRGDVVILP